MGIRDQLAARRFRATRAFVSRMVRAYVFLLLLGITGFVAYVLVREGAFESDAVAPPPSTEVALSFGFNREPITRQFSLDVDITNEETGASEEIVSVRPASDLRQSQASGEFPSEQVTVGINRLTGGRIVLTVTADPWEPERVAAGLYEGTLELRGAGASESVPISIWLRSRQNKWAVAAFGLLVLGATVGLLVKWVTERLTPQAAQARRLWALKTAIGYDEDLPTLPPGVRLRVQRLEDAISREDYAAAENEFDALREHEESLSLVSARMSGLLDVITSQVEYVDRYQKRFRPTDQLLLTGVFDAEYEAVQDLFSGWSDVTPPEHYMERVARTRFYLSAITNILSAFADNPRSSLLRSAFESAQSADFEAAHQLYERWHEGGPNAEVAVRAEDGAVAEVARGLEFGPLKRQRPLSFVFRYARLFAGAASVVVVSLVGLKLEYLDDQQFNGSLSAWLGLLLWSAVVELSGVSVVDVVGRLSTSTRSGTVTQRGTAA